MSIPVSDILKNQDNISEEVVPVLDSDNVSSFSSFKIDYKQVLFLLLASMAALRIPYHNLDHRLLTLGKDPLIALLTVILFYILTMFISF
jgi:hypothetical protein